MIRKLLSPLLLLVLWAALGCAETPTTGKVSWIDDGDSFRLASGEQVRLLGIDTPESRHSPNRDRYYTRYGITSAQLRRTAKKALHFNIRLLKNQEIRLEYDHEERDKYNRLLAYVYLPDGRMINRLLLEKGYATVFRRFDFDRKDEFLQIEHEARKEKQGMWKTAD